MKVIFICGSVDPGRDGVGDYTRRLCATLYKLGITVGILAINDGSVSKPEETTQNEDGVNVEVYRLPNTLAQKKRYKLAYSWIDKINPNWLSLQYVPYSFSQKGIPIGISSKLLKIGKGRKWHIMFHELAIGIEVGASIKDILIGKVQIQIIRSLLQKLNPSIVHTQTHLYRQILNDIGFNSSYLPLFSNIPRENKIDSTISDKKKLIHKSKNLNFLVFGGIQPNSPIDSFIMEAKNFASTNNLSMKMIFVGRNGKELTNWSIICKKNSVNFEILGEKPRKEISYILSDANYGISTTPFILSEKSGSVAAMHLHSLPVICVARDWVAKVKINKNNSSVMNYQVGNFDNMINNSQAIHKIDNTVTQVAKLFLNSLNVKNL